MEAYIKRIAQTLNLRLNHIQRTLELLDEGATIPFISRYRKEATGGMDEVMVARVAEEYQMLKELFKRKDTILSTIEEQGKLTPELRQKIEECFVSNELEDIYLPYKPKRKTRATAAREKGLEPLATWLMLQQSGDLVAKAQAFVKGEVKDIDDALKGARDIISEVISENQETRQNIRAVFERESIISSVVVKGKEEEGVKYRDYFDFNEPLRRCSSHRLLALRRGEAEGILRVSISPNDEHCVERMERQYVRGCGVASEQMQLAVVDSYKRLLKPSIENEFASLSKTKADEEAIKVFADNTRQLLLASPLGEKRVLAIDPGYRTGCKVVCLDAQGSLLHNEAVFPHPPQQERQKTVDRLLKLVKEFRVEAIAIGNGTAGRETEELVREVISDIPIIMVSENGASVYSASAIAREEFPDKDVTVRGAVSIGRRLMDPLAELVKIDPKSIGVGQYQHDVEQSKLKQALDMTVESCVNRVGINLNTASRHLLTYVSGLGPVLAGNIVDYRTEHGAFKSRRELLKVKRLGEKAFEQCAGFLRIPGAKNPLDNSAVHPERYGVVEQMAKDIKLSVKEMIGNGLWRKQVKLDQYVEGELGLPTLNDIASELEKLGLDPRGEMEVFSFDASVRTIDDLKEGMILPGIVNNITQFGCFVDVGIKESGLVHVSQMADRFISDPAQVVTIHQPVKVRVLSVDKERKRVQLSLKLS